MENFDKKKKSRPLPPLDYGTTVWVNLQDRQVSGTVSHSADAPRSYHVNVPSGQVRRNGRDLRPRQQSTLPDRGTENTSNSVMTRSRTGASMYPPDRLTTIRSELKRGDVICVPYIIIDLVLLSIHYNSIHHVVIIGMCFVIINDSVLLR